MTKIARLLACGVVAVALVAGSGVAQAGSSKGRGAAKAQRAAQAAALLCAHGRLAGPVVRAAAAYIGITPQQLRQELAGHSLAQVAASHNKSVEGLQQALVDAVKAKLDKRVAAQRLTQQQADARLARFQQRVGQLVNRVVSDQATARCARVALRGVALKAAAQYLGLTKKQLREQLAGHSLAQLAAAQNKSVDGLEQAMVAAVKAKLDKLVANQRLTQERANAVLARFQDRVDELVNKVFPARS